MDEELYTKSIWLIALIVLVFFVIFIIQNTRTISLDLREADVIIIGGGTAGCILSRRLSEKGVKNITVLDKGEDHRDDPEVYNMINANIAASSRPFSILLPSDYEGVDISLATMYGGSSSHNFGLAVHGSEEFYNTVWGPILDLDYKDFVSYFKRIETYNGMSQNPETRGTKGPLQVTPFPDKINLLQRVIPIVNKALSPQFLFVDGVKYIRQALDIASKVGPLRASNGFSDTYMNAVRLTKNVPIVEDYNTGIVNCTSKKPQLFIESLTGIRDSTNVAYWATDFISINSSGDGKRKKNLLQTVPNVNVERILFEGNQAVGIEYTPRNRIQSETLMLNPGGKIIVCAGAICSPFILQKSGIEVPGIGENLINHYGFNFIVSVEANDEDFDFSNAPIAFIPFEDINKRAWQIVISGPDSLNKPVLETIGVDADAELKKNPKLRYLTFLLWDLDPKSRGSVSSEGVNPDVKLNMFSAPEDMISLIAGMRWLAELSTIMKLTYPTWEPVYPPRLVLERNDPLELAGYIRDGISVTSHYCATCKLGVVTNPTDFSVIGYPNLYVVDASVFPGIPDGNTEFPVAVMAEIASDRIPK